MDRRRLFSLPAFALADLVVVRSGKMSPAREILDYFDREVRKLTEAFEKAAPAAVAVRICRDQPVAESLVLEGGYSGRDMVRLHRAAGRFAALKGAALADLGDPAGAMDAFATAFGHTYEAGDRQAQAWVRCWQSALARKPGGPRAAAGAVSLAQDAGRIAGRGTPQHARAAICEAWGHAVAGERRDVHEAVARAWDSMQTLSHEGKGTPGFSFDTLHVGDLGEMCASVYLELGKPALAATYTSAVMTDLDVSGASFRQARARIVGATAEVGRDRERALALVSEALDLAADRPAARLTTALDRFLAAMWERAPGADLADLAERVRVWSLPKV